MKKLLAAVAIAVMPLAGCATIAKETGNKEVPVYDERALLTAEVAYGTALAMISQADAVGLITPDVAAKLEPAVIEAQAAIETARNLYETNRIAEANTEGQSAVLKVAIILQILINAGVVK